MIVDILGQGGMSTVYLAEDSHINQKWAIKEIHKVHHLSDINNDYIFVSEVNMMKQLNHYTIPMIVDVIENEKSYYIVMEYIKGITLDQIIKEKGKVNEKQAIRWAKQIVEGLHYLHTRNPAIIYRDLKPSNIIVKPDGNIKIIDFGIARNFNENSIDDTMHLGTVGFAAPEQFGGGQSDERTDIYSLGVTMFYMLTGKSILEFYQMKNNSAIRHCMSPEMFQVIEKCTNINRDERFKNCKEVLAALAIADTSKIRKKTHHRISSFKLLFIAFGLFITATICIYQEMHIVNQTASVLLSPNSKINFKNFQNNYNILVYKLPESISSSQMGELSIRYLDLCADELEKISKNTKKISDTDIWGEIDKLEITIIPQLNKEAQNSCKCMIATIYWKYYWLDEKDELKNMYAKYEEVSKRLTRVKNVER